MLGLATAPSAQSFIGGDNCTELFYVWRGWFVLLGSVLFIYLHSPIWSYQPSTELVLLYVEMITEIGKLILKALFFIIVLLSLFKFCLSFNRPESFHQFHPFKALIKVSNQSSQSSRTLSRWLQHRVFVCTQSKLFFFQMLFELLSTDNPLNPNQLEQTPLACSWFYPHNVLANLIVPLQLICCLPPLCNAGTSSANGLLITFCFVWNNISHKTPIVLSGSKAASFDVSQQMWHSQGARHP